MDTFCTKYREKMEAIPITPFESQFSVSPELAMQPIQLHCILKQFKNYTQYPINFLVQILKYYKVSTLAELNLAMMPPSERAILNPVANE